MSIDTNFIPAFSIEEVLLDKDTGAPLSGGQVYFEQDNNRGVLKPVYQITGTSPNYSFIQLPNPMTLSAIGTFEDSLGNPVVPYFFPFDSNFDPELYYIRVESAGGVPQFTREAVPYVNEGGSGGVTGAFENEISNPQFSEVLFDTESSSHVYNFNTASLEVVPLAPDWDLIVSSAAVATVTVSQTRPAGSLNIETNPGTLLNINSAGVSRLRLRQRIYGSPNLWGNGYLAGTFLAKTFGGTSSTVTMYYSQSNGTVVDTVITSGVLNGDGTYDSHPGSVLIPSSDSANTFPNAYVDIELDLPLGVQIEISSIMLSFTANTSFDTIEFDQESQNRQVDHLFHYYKPQLEYKPIPSYLVGWDFPLNPAQFPGGRTQAASAIGANKSKYVWDQTIVYQSVDSGVGVTGGSGGELVLTAAAATQAAIIQYLPATLARKILNDRIAVNVQAKASVAVNATISLWYTTDGTLPNVATGTNNSLIATIDANGKPATFNGNWTEVPRGDLGDALFEIGTNATTNFNDYGFSEWDLEGDAAANTATFFAIVIGTAQITSSETVSIYNVGLCSGDIATRPAAQSPEEVQQECEYYYEMSFLSGSANATATTAGELVAPMVGTIGTTNTADVYANSFGNSWKTLKYAAPNLIFYNGTSTATDQVNAYGIGTSGTSNNARNVGTFWGSKALTTKAFHLQSLGESAGALVSGVTNTGNSNPIAAWIYYHYVADARLGII